MIHIETETDRETRAHTNRKWDSRDKYSEMEKLEALRERGKRGGGGGRTRVCV